MAVEIKMAQERRVTPVDLLTTRFIDRMAAVDDILSHQLGASSPLIPQVASHLIGAGGKRVRPLLTIASAQLCGGANVHSEKLAAAVEFIHSATLLHDDVVDGSDLRRGRPAANRLFGNKPTILVGDYLFSRAFQLMVETGSVEVLKILSDASAIISQGEIQQLATANNLATTREQHLSVIRAKTAALFSAAMESGAMVGGGSEEQIEALRVYGDSIGIAFQLVDDALDYAGQSLALGKDAGDDFLEGKVTAPVLYAVEDATSEEKKFWSRTIERSEYQEGDFDLALSYVSRSRAVEQTLLEARGYGAMARDALSQFPETPLRAELDALIDYIVDRDS